MKLEKRTGPFKINIGLAIQSSWAHVCMRSFYLVFFCFGSLLVLNYGLRHQQARTRTEYSSHPSHARLARLDIKIRKKKAHPLQKPLIELFTMFRTPCSSSRDSSASLCQ